VEWLEALSITRLQDLPEVVEFLPDVGRRGLPASRRRADIEAYDVFYKKLDRPHRDCQSIVAFAMEQMKYTTCAALRSPRARTPDPAGKGLAARRG